MPNIATPNGLLCAAHEPPRNKQSQRGVTMTFSSPRKIQIKCTILHVVYISMIGMRYGFHCVDRSHDILLRASLMRMPFSRSLVLCEVTPPHRHRDGVEGQRPSLGAVCWANNYQKHGQRQGECSVFCSWGTIVHTVYILVMNFISLHDSPTVIEEHPHPLPTNIPPII